MPFDKAGKHHLSTQKAMASDKMPNVHKQSGMGAKGVGDPMPDGKNESDLGGDSTRTLISHNGDGSHSVQHSDGDETGPHASLQEAIAEILAKHGEPDGDEGAGDSMMKHHMPEHAMMSGM